MIKKSILFSSNTSNLDRHFQKDFQICIEIPVSDYTLNDVTIAVIAQGHPLYKFQPYIISTSWDTAVKGIKKCKLERLKLTVADDISLWTWNTVPCYEVIKLRYSKIIRRKNDNNFWLSDIVVVYGKI